MYEKNLTYFLFIEIIPPHLPLLDEDPVSLPQGSKCRSMLCCYQLMAFIFSADTLLDAAECATRAIISLHKTSSVDCINNLVLDRVPRDVYTLVGSTSLDHEHLEGNTDDVFAIRLLLGGAIPTLNEVPKKGIVVMLTRNLSIDDRLTKCTKLVILGVSSHVLHVKTLDV